MEISWLINASWIQNRVVIYRGPLKFWRINQTNLNSKIVVFLKCASCKLGTRDIFFIHSTFTIILFALHARCVNIHYNA